MWMGCVKSHVSQNMRDMGHSVENGALKSRTSTTSLAERWQLHQIVFWDRLQRLSSLAPGGEAADDHERVEASFLQ